MSELSEMVTLLESVRADMREGFREVKSDLREIKRETKTTNGRVTELETRDFGDQERKRRWRDWVPQVITALGSTILSVLLYAVFLAH